MNLGQRNDLKNKIEKYDAYSDRIEKLESYLKTKRIIIRPEYKNVCFSGVLPNDAGVIEIEGLFELLDSTYIKAVRDEIKKVIQLRNEL